MICPVCGGAIIGDGYTIAYHCENIDLQPDWEPDSGIHYCPADNRVDGIDGPEIQEYSMYR